MKAEQTEVERARPYLFSVAQTSKSAVPQVSKPAARNEEEPTWKSAARQVWKPALPKFGALRLCAVSHHLRSIVFKNFIVLIAFH
jgi:hypothetical protein